MDKEYKIEEFCGKFTILVYGYETELRFCFPSKKSGWRFIYPHKIYAWYYANSKGNICRDNEKTLTFDYLSTAKEVVRMWKKGVIYHNIE